MSKYLKTADFGASDYLNYKGGVVWYEAPGKFHARTSGKLGVFATAAAAKAAISRYSKPRHK